MTWLIVKEEFYDKAMDTFKTTGIGISVNGKRHLGAAIGKRSFGRICYHKGRRMG